MLLGLCIATLRLACCELMRPTNRLGGTVSAVELTTIKLVISSSVALILAAIFEAGSEAGDYSDNNNNHDTIEATDSWWYSFGQLPSQIQLGVMGGALLIAVFQVNCTFLTWLTSAVSVGLVGQVKIIPQWIMAAIFAKLTSDFTLQGPNLIGACLIMTSAATFAGSKFCTTNTNNHNNTRDKNEQQHRQSLDETEKQEETKSTSGSKTSISDDDSSSIAGDRDEEEGGNLMVTNERTGLLLSGKGKY